MKRNIIIIAVVLIVIVAAYALWNQNTAPAAAPATSPAPTQTTATNTTSGAPLMQSTGVAFSSSPDYARSHEVYPTMASDAKQALSAFSITTKDLGSGATQVTLTNGAEGYQGQSVVVGPGQSVYFIEKSTGDDSDTEDSSTRDDYLLAVDAQGNMLK
jgi:hypothetical protein